MHIQPMMGITPLWDELAPLSSQLGNQPAESPAQGELGAFGNIFSSAIENVKQTEAEKVQTEYLLATGQLDNPAISSIANTKAQMSVELLVQLRNKALDSYNELMRISL